MSKQAQIRLQVMDMQSGTFVMSPMLVLPGKKRGDLYTVWIDRNNQVHVSIVHDDNVPGEREPVEITSELWKAVKEYVDAFQALQERKAEVRALLQ